MNKNVSPVGWYVANYILRRVEIDRADTNDLDARFLSWENTIIVKAKDLDEAYDKAIEFAKLDTESHMEGPKDIYVQWVLEGVSENWGHENWGQSQFLSENCKIGVSFNF